MSINVYQFSLQAMVAHGRVELLAHPLSQKYLQMKWNAYGKYFHVTNLLIYTVFLFFVTLYASQLMQNVGTNNIQDWMNTTAKNSTGEVCIRIFFLDLFKCPINICVSFFFIDCIFKFQHAVASKLVHSKTIHNRIDTNPSQGFMEKQINVSTAMMVSGIAIMIYIILSTFREFIQIYQQKWQYLFEPNNFISWMVYVSASIMVSPIFSGGWITDTHFSATSVTVFFSWFNLLLFLQRFDQVCCCFFFVLFSLYIYNESDFQLFSDLSVNIFFSVARLEFMWSCFWKFYKH